MVSSTFLCWAPVLPEASRRGMGVIGGMVQALEEQRQQKDILLTTSRMVRSRQDVKLGSFCRTIGMLNPFDSSTFDMRKRLYTKDLRSVKHVLSTWSRFDGTSRQISQILLVDEVLEAANLTF